MCREAVAKQVWIDTLGYSGLYSPVTNPALYAAMTYPVSPNTNKQGCFTLLSQFRAVLQPFFDGCQGLSADRYQAGFFTFADHPDNRVIQINVPRV
jgi:hypothetical protein